MKSEEIKYIEVLHKARDLKKSFEELKPESRQRLICDLLGVATFQEAMYWIQMMSQNNFSR